MPSPPFPRRVTLRAVSCAVALASTGLSLVIAPPPSGARAVVSSGVVSSGDGPVARPAPRVTGPAIVGRARVVDGDTLDIGGVRVRVEGIDAPEAGQTCTGRGGTPWPCGAAATRQLAAWTRDRPVRCTPHGQDAYGRTLATCRDGDRDLGADLVRAGLAWAFVKYSARYVAEEAAARRARAGVWQGPAQAPWVHRATRWQAAAVTAPRGCAIKGNISRGGRLYHLPWSRWYASVVLDPRRGERWFCSEAEAAAHGWRPASRAL
jgi:endonuclease YncB( thermonuclease family)